MFYKLFEARCRLPFDYSKFAYFQVVDELSPIIIGMAQEDLVNMNAWCKKTFKKNGLLKKIQDSQITTAESKDKAEKSSDTPFFGRHS